MKNLFTLLLLFIGQSFSDGLAHGHYGGIRGNTD